MPHKEILPEVIDMSLKASPPLAVTGMTVLGLPLPDLVSIVTLAYLGIHICYILSKWFRGK